MWRCCLPAWQSSGERGAGPVGMGAPLRCGGSLGPTHGGGVMRWPGNGGSLWKQRTVGGGAY
jgi:hypothetical protein